MSAVLSVRPVRAAGELRAFLELPVRLHGAEPRFVPELRRMEREHLTPGRNPFWKQAERELFVAWRDAAPVGRIVAVSDAEADRRAGYGVGGWGYFVCARDLEAASALFDAAEMWHRARSGTTLCLRGPLNPSLNHTCGMLVEGFDVQPSFMMPWNPPYYAELAEVCGMTQEKDLFSYRFRNDVKERLITRTAHADESGDTVLRVSSRDTYERDVALLCELFAACWADNWGFTPIPPEQMFFMLKELRLLPDFMRLLFMEQDGETSAAALLAADLGPLLRALNGEIGLGAPWHLWRKTRQLPGWRIMLFGVREQFRGLRAAAVFLREVLAMVNKDPALEYIDAGWVLENNADLNLLCAGLGGTRVTTHRIWRREVLYV